jgi:hypothetical protein
MSVVLETAIHWVPFAVGIADASLTAYYANHFSISDVDTIRGTLGGQSGSALLGLSAASIAVQGWAMFEWIKLAVKKEEGKLSSHSRNMHYGRSMMVYMWIMLIFYMVAISSAALNVQLVTKYSDVDAVVQSGKLGGTFGDAVEGLAYATIGVGGMGLFTYLYAEFFARSINERHPTVLEAHGGY